MSNDIKVYKWDEISNDFNHSILLGNGASRAVDDSFSYANIFNKAQGEHISEEIKKIFEHFETDDFEYVLMLLWHSYHVNQSLGIKESKTDEAYKSLRDALIKTVRDIHPEHDSMLTHFITIYNFLKKFKTVLNLNYDLLVYWSMLYGKEKYHEQHFKDCFIHRIFKYDFENLRQPYGKAKDSTLVFYPHGSLILATNLHGQEEKIDKSGTKGLQLLELILENWKSGNCSPLFVSEGTSTQKERAVRRSSYLTTVYDRVIKEDIGETLVIYGWSASEQDKHIINALLSNKTLKKIAISINTQRGDVYEKCNRFHKNFKPNKEREICFFDAASKGCWIHE